MQAATRTRHKGSAPEIVLRHSSALGPPRNFLDPGAFDLRGYLARQKIDLIGSLRSGARASRLKR
jgi:hypothetical protein